MLIGNGLLANTFLKYKNDNSVLIFASGVSNSLETNETEFNREKNLLLSNLSVHQKRKFIYFSTCSIYDPSLSESPYILHKQKIESLIVDNHDDYLIIRLPNIVGNRGNEHTLINYFVSAIRSDEQIRIWKNATRNLLDQADMFILVENILNAGCQNEIINVANPIHYRVIDILREVEICLVKKANYILLDKGASYTIDISKIVDMIHDLNRDFSIKYLKSILKKYY